MSFLDLKICNKLNLNIKTAASIASFKQGLKKEILENLQ